MEIYKSDSLIRRYLSFSKGHNSSDKLPALTRSALVDVEIYSIIAIICRDYINIWYEQMTHDKSFIEELLFLVSHVVKELENRFFTIKHETLFLQSIPMIAIKHINGKLFLCTVWRIKLICIDIRKAQKIVQTDISSHKTFDEVFHGFQQHPALDSQENEKLYLRLVVDGLITSLLPSNDLESECERILSQKQYLKILLKEGRNPDVYTRQFCELVQKDNQYYTIRYKSNPVITQDIKNNFSNMINEVEKILNNTNRI
ncbi:hypothetical protein PCK2_000062 [Pneumocystis canis]|nr:hypothetical protein PCK2_000062 [Pneumocystis canis]